MKLPSLLTKTKLKSIQVTSKQQNTRQTTTNHWP